MKTTRQHRGVAMLLVIISVAMATILTVAYLSSRDNSIAIGNNITNAALARWSSESGIEITKVALQTNQNWRTAHSNGRLISSLAVGSAFVDVDLIDVATGNPPTATTRFVYATATADVDGVQQISSATFQVLPNGNGEANVDLSEFAIFLETDISLEDTSSVTRWPNAPLSKLNKGIAIGTRAHDMGSIDLSGSTTPIDTTVYSDNMASAFLVSQGSSVVTVNEIRMQNRIPFPEAPQPGVPLPGMTGSYADIILDETMTIVSSDVRSNSIWLKRGATVVMRGDITIVSDTFHNLTVGSRIIIDGNVKLIVFGDLSLQNSSIELTEGSILTMFVGKNLTMSGSYIGEIRPDNIRDNTGDAPYMDPDLIQIFSIREPSIIYDWTLTKNSVIKGVVFAPSVHIFIGVDSALYGCFAAYSSRIIRNGAVYYDHTLDNGQGYTNDLATMFNLDETIKVAFRSLASLNSASVDSLAQSELVKIVVNRNVYDYRAPVAILPIDPSLPTPRPIQVNYTLDSTGGDVLVWEAKAY